MIKRILFFLLLFNTCFFSCKKQEVPTIKFTITASLQTSSSVLITWAPFNLSGFKNVTIYRSSSPIPDPTFETPIDGSLMVGLVTDIAVTNFKDSTINNFATGGILYYKAVITLNDRVIVSNQQQVSLDAFSITLSTGNQFGNFFVSRLSEINALYVLNTSNNSISYINYTQKKILATTIFPGNSSGNTVIYSIMDNNNPEVFVASNNSIICYNGTTLSQKYSITVPGTIYDLKVKNGFLYVFNYYSTGNSYYNIQTYNLTNQTLVSQKNYSYTLNIQGNISDIYTANQSNAFYFKYYSQNYNSQIGNYVYKNALVFYTLVNGLPIDSTVLNISALNTGLDTLQNNNSNLQYIQVSPDGGYITCDNFGDIYSVNGHSTHNISSLNNSNPTPVYSDDGSYMVGRTISFSSGAAITPLDIWSLPGFHLVTSLSSPNPTTASIANDYMDNDTLVSYNITETSTTSQVVNTLTVFLNKIN